MSYFSWIDAAADAAFTVDTLEPRIRTLSDESVSPLSGDVQTNSLPGSRWGWQVTIPQQRWDERRRVWALLMRLSGREHRLKFWDLMQPDPVGTIPLTGVTVKTTAAQFANTLTLATGVPGCTLLRGDWIKLGPADTAQTVRVVLDATADGAGDITVNFRQMLRAAVTAGTAVVLDKPAGLYVLAESNLQGGPVGGGGGIAEPFSFELVEVFS